MWISLDMGGEELKAVITPTFPPQLLTLGLRGMNHILPMEQLSITARISVSQENRQGLSKGKNQNSSSRLSDLLMKSIQDSSFSKMCLTSEPKDLTEFCKNLPKGGMIVDGQCYRQPKPVGQSINERGGFYLPTLSATEGGPMPEVENPQLGHRNYSKKTGKHCQMTLRRAMMLPPLTCRDATTSRARPPEKMIRSDGRNVLRVSGMAETLMREENYPKTKLTLPTLGKDEYKGTAKNRFIGSPTFRGAKTSEGLRTCETDPIYLNPLFGEKIMGYPAGWTALNVLGIAFFHSKRGKHLKD